MSKKHYTKRELEEYSNVKKVCKWCGCNFYDTWSKYTLSEFCSKKCSKTYSSNVNKDEANKKKSITLKKYFDNLSKEEYREKYLKNKNERKRCNSGVKTSKENREHYYSNPKICPICNGVIPYERRHCKTCSKECGGRAIVQTKLEKGYYDDPNRHFVTSKCGYYKGIYCGSTYELVYTIYNLDHNIPFERNKKGFPYEYNGKIHHYYPDYITPDGYVEIKGYWTDKVDVKLASVDKSIVILYKKDLKYAFDYVSKTYMNGKKTGWQVLYDNHKPKYEKVCPECGITFSTETKRTKFCSHSCSVKYYSLKRTQTTHHFQNRSNVIPEGFHPIPTLDGYYINNEKKVWSSRFGGKLLKLQKQKGIYEKYLLSKDKKQKWYYPDELYNMTFNT